MHFTTDNMYAFFSVNVIEVLSIRCSICGTGFVRLRNAGVTRILSDRILIVNSPGYVIMRI